MKRPASILVVGGGPAGLVALFELLQAFRREGGTSTEIELFERRSEVGGVWNYEGTGARVDSRIPNFPSPAYENLVGNVLPPLLQFGSFKLPTPARGPFPTMKETHDWLLGIARPLRKHIKLKRHIIGIKPGHAECDWLVTYKDWSEDGVERTVSFDAVIVATGAFDTPYFPPIEGLADFLRTDDPRVMHAKYYRGPKEYENQYNRVLVVGNSNSGNDIASHLMHLNDGPVYRSIRNPSRFANVPTRRIEDVAPVVKVSLQDSDNTLTVLLKDGRTIQGITKMILATGYCYDFSWTQVPDAEGQLRAPSYLGAVPNLYAATFVKTRPTLAFNGINVTSNPVPLSEVQARVIANVWSGTLDFPTDLSDTDDLFVNKSDLKDEPGGWRSLHMLRGEKERQLCQFLLDWLDSSDPVLSKDLFRWDEERETVAKGMRAAKEADLRRTLDFN